MSQEYDSIITARDLHKWYGNFHALKGINMEVKRREVIVIFGPSGSGKSTFIRTINRLEEHQRGDIIVDGIELSHDVRNIEQVRMETGMVFQQFNLFPHLTVLQNITLAPIQVRKWTKKKAEDVAMQLLARVGIPEQAQKYPGQLSGGQQQRAFLARAIAQEPHILLMDEPFTGVDVTTQEVTLNLLEHLKSKEVTTIVSTHDLNLAASRFDLVLLINHRLIAFGTPREVFIKENLAQAFGNSLLVMENGMMLVDECCSDEEEHYQHAEVK